MCSYTEIRKEMEGSGYILEDSEYEKVVTYARRKAEVSGKDESYMPYLLPDVIREWVTRQAINAVTIAAMTVEKIIEQEVKNNGRSNTKRVAVDD